MLFHVIRAFLRDQFDERATFHLSQLEGAFLPGGRRLLTSSSMSSIPVADLILAKASSKFCIRSRDACASVLLVNVAPLVYVWGRRSIAGAGKEVPRWRINHFSLLLYFRRVPCKRYELGAGRTGIWKPSRYGASAFNPLTLPLGRNTSSRYLPTFALNTKVETAFALDGTMCLLPCTRVHRNSVVSPSAPSCSSYQTSPQPSTALSDKCNRAFPS